MSRFFFSLAGLLSALVAAYDAKMPLYVLAENDPGVLAGAACLDGTPPAYYYSPATSAALNTTWALHLKGGAWCATAADCLKRSRGMLGSSSVHKGVPTSFGFSGSVVDPNPRTNPDFAGGHRVILWYCDGGSFAGHRGAPLLVDGTALQLRGKANLAALLGALRRDRGLGGATEVVLSGGSAGGLAALLHADAVRGMLPPRLARYGVAPISGFFLAHAPRPAAYNGTARSYPAMMADVYVRSLTFSLRGRAMCHRTGLVSYLSSDRYSVLSAV